MGGAFSLAGSKGVKPSPSILRHLSGRKHPPTLAQGDGPGSAGVVLGWLATGDFKRPTKGL